MSRHKISTFRVDGALYGVDAMRVKEVGRHADLTRVPLAPPTVAGILNLRGDVVTALDLRRLLGLPDRAADDRPMNVVLRGDGCSVRAAQSRRRSRRSRRGGVAAPLG